MEPAHRRVRARTGTRAPPRGTRCPTRAPSGSCATPPGGSPRRYTKAFDIAHPGWQRYFLDACADLVRRLDVDGFRVDAPTYNDFASWAPGRGGRASDGAMASLGLLRDLRERLRSLRPELAVYTEPTGGLFRAVADATYNYDEHWLVEALLGAGARGRRLARGAHRARAGPLAPGPRRGAAARQRDRAPHRLARLDLVAPAGRPVAARALRPRRRGGAARRVRVRRRRAS